jgi:hypothetical protein
MKTETMIRQDPKGLLGHILMTEDGEVGKVTDVWSEMGTGTICYLVLDTGRHLPGRRGSLLLPVLCPPDWVERIFVYERLG